MLTPEREYGLKRSVESATYLIPLCFEGKSRSIVWVNIWFQVTSSAIVRDREFVVAVEQAGDNQPRPCQGWRGRAAIDVTLGLGITRHQAPALVHNRWVTSTFPCLVKAGARAPAPLPTIVSGRTAKGAATVVACTTPSGSGFRPGTG